MSRHFVPAGALWLLLCSSPLFAFPEGLGLSSDLPSGQLVGTPVTWTVTATGTAPMDFRLSAGPVGGTPRVWYDFSPQRVFRWTPIEEGTHQVVVSVRDLDRGETTEVVASYEIVSLAPLVPVVTPTANPLVALYSAPPCLEGSRMRVVFVPQGSAGLTSTNSKPCRTGRSMNFYIAGMREQTIYRIIHEVRAPAGRVQSVGPVRFHTTGSIPIEFPQRAVAILPGPESSALEDVVLVAASGGFQPFPFATDRLGRVIWYHDRDIGQQALYFRPVTGGTFLLAGSEGPRTGQILKEVDLAGELVRQTTPARITEQLLEMGHTDPVNSFHHEARRLPNGHTVVLASTERVIEDVQGPGPVDVLADYILDLDENFQVSWVWNPYDHLDVTRKAVLGETCSRTIPGCQPFFLADTAQDWLHTNTLTYSPLDGSLLVSQRHQDWILKIDYQDGQGSGEVLWRLGRGGDFILDSADPRLWFSHQHDPNYVTPDQIVVYDNGNVRCELGPPQCFSRGQVYAIDEETVTASLILNADLENYSLALGSSQPMLNGNFHFDSGIQRAGLDYFSSSDEVGPDGAINYSILFDVLVYRSWRLIDLYHPDAASPF